MNHCFTYAKAIAASAKGGVIEDCGGRVFEEWSEFVCEQFARSCLDAR
jgi:hypothetical protein